MVPSPWRSQRLLEWGLVASVLFALIWAFERQAQAVQGQAERLAVRLTLKSLRDTLTLAQMLKASRLTGATVQPESINPFAMLHSIPTNFAGNVAASNAGTVPPGNWVFDPVCVCIGYRLLYPQWLEPAQAGDTLWFRIEVVDGVLRLIPQDRYLWFEQVLL